MSLRHGVQPNDEEKGVRERITRAKRLDTKEWVLGNLLYFEGNEDFDPEAFICELVDDNRGELANSIIETTIETGVEVQSANIYKVDPETIGDWTGLTDKNGVKIFEGDIVKLNAFSGDDIAEIKMRDGYFEICAYQKSRDLWQTLSRYTGAQWEVVGNITDNPELLKAQAALKEMK